MENKNQIECPRCSGTGKVEHTHVVYGVCFMCAGYGTVTAQRVVELNTKAHVRKVKKQEKRNAVLAQEKIDNEKRQMSYEKWQFDKNISFYNAKVNQALSVGAIHFLSQVEGISKFVKCDTRKLFEEMISDYFKGSAFDFRFELSKYTSDNFGFIFMEIPRGFDLELGSSLLAEYEYQN